MPFRTSISVSSSVCAAALMLAPGAALALGVGSIEGEVADRFGFVFDDFEEASGVATSFQAAESAQTEAPRDAATSASISFEETVSGSTLTSAAASGETHSTIGDFSNLAAKSISQYSVGFDVPEQSSFVLFGTLAATQQNQTGTAASARVTMFPGVLEARLDTRGGTGAFHVEGVLPIGSYSIEALAENAIGTPPFHAQGRSSFQLTLFVGPAPCDNVFTEQADEITGTPGDDVLCGGGGIDTIDGAGGNDVIFGGDGNDIIVAGEGDDTVFGENGDDDIQGGADADLLVGGDGDDSIDGGNGDDDLFGGRDDDTLDGAGGSDNIAGERGKDTITGGAGDDSLLDGGSGDDDIFGCGGADDLVGGTGEDELYGDIADPDDGCASGELEPNAGSVLPARDILIGGGGNDLLFGGNGNDRLRGGTGDDTVQGELGDDSVLGGPGNDIAIGGPGEDKIEGGRGNDGLASGDGEEDRVDGGEGCDAADGFYDDGLDILVSVEEPDGVCAP